jgi:2-C-methyl-D-erythritol 2,4-cyclodiphosphate synthase
MRTGIGYDIHALKKGRKLILGGIEIPHPKGLLGHSDGDVLFHALVDAVLGALGEGDVGTFFPDTDRRFRGISSHVFVKKARQLLTKKGYRISNMDSTLVAESPKLYHYRDRIRENLAKQFGLKVSQVGFKAKTNEGFGAVGERQAIACFAVVSLEKAESRKRKVESGRKKG